MTEFDTRLALVKRQDQTAAIRKKRYGRSRLDRHHDTLISLHIAGATPAELRRWLRQEKRIRLLTRPLRAGWQSMAKFAKPATQAGNVIRAIQGTVLRSVGTARNYEQALTRVAEYTRAERLPGGLRDLTPTRAITYLEKRGQSVGQKTLDMERQAIQCMMIHVTGALGEKEKLPVVRSKHAQVLTSRAYTPEQIRLITRAQNPANRLATELAYSAGLRAHELHTLRPAAERQADGRPALAEKFQGRAGQRYTVTGKGGLTREVLLPTDLTQRLEAMRLPLPERITDRGIHYSRVYALPGGKNWSSSFSSASRRVLGRSEGAHGVRHSLRARAHERTPAGRNRP